MTGQTIIDLQNGLVKYIYGVNHILTKLITEGKYSGYVEIVGSANVGGKVETTDGSKNIKELLTVVKSKNNKGLVIFEIKVQNISNISPLVEKIMDSYVTKNFAKVEMDGQAKVYVIE